MKLKLFLFSILYVFIVASCSDDDSVDTTAPDIVIKQPSDHSHFHPGETIHLHAFITDNEELASWKIDIHYNDDEHTHSQVFALKNGDEDHDEEWRYVAEGSIEGGVKSFELEYEIIIAEDAPHGIYDLGVFAIDNAGNESVVWIEIEVEEQDSH